MNPLVVGAMPAPFGCCGPDEIGAAHLLMMMLAVVLLLPAVSVDTAETVC